MTKSDINFDLREHSEIFSLEGKAEKITIVYPALNLKGESVNVKIRFKQFYFFLSNIWKLRGLRGFSRSLAASRVWHFSFKTSRFQNFSNFSLESDSVWYRKKYQIQYQKIWSRIQYWKKLVSEKKSSFSIVQILGIVTHWLLHPSAHRAWSRLGAFG